ncbi:MAG: UDP-diphosphatase [Waddliaceae bacterium]|nr:UDP-diphosphatase [Waddliaceae bacterium]
MSSLDALIMGVLQGLTEFLPVSSSGHLKLAQIILGYKDLGKYILFDLLCHLGTLLAILIVFHKDIRDLLRNNRKQVFFIFIGMLPLVPVYLLRDQLNVIINNTQLLGAFFLLTAAFLALGERKTDINPNPSRSRWYILQLIVVGCAQAIAVIPGVSRSGLTISTARAFSWSPQEAARFSFLLAIPTILGGVFVEGLRACTHCECVANLSWKSSLIAFVSSAVCGYLALNWLLTLLQRGKLTLFVWYCGVIGILTLILTNK